MTALLRARPIVTTFATASGLRPLAKGEKRCANLRIRRLTPTLGSVGFGI
jgi:hypothetical protein